MALVTINVDVAQELGVGSGRYRVVTSAAPRVLPTTQTAVQDAMDVLQTDAATPTEAHVDDADTAWDALVAELATVPGEVHVTYDDAEITSYNQFKAALDAVLFAYTTRA